MTSQLTLHATLSLPIYQAEQGEPNHRTAEAVIVPYGTPGRTSAGLKSIKAGALRIIDGAPVIGLYGHRTPGVEPRGVSRLIAHEERPDGLFGRLRVAETPLGDELLAEIRGGVREGVSVELSEVVYDPRDPDLVISARLDAVAHVPLPAYDSARVHALAASLTTDGEPVTAPAPAPADEAQAVTLSAEQFTTLLAAVNASGAAPSATAEPAPSLSAAAALGLSTAGVTLDQAVEDPIHAAARLQAAVFQGNRTPELRAALADITNTGLDLFQNPAGTLGEKLWEGAGYTRRFVPLMRQKELTSWKFLSWQWVNRPKVAAYAGDKAEIPTNTVSVEQFENEATRVAGGWDIDRKFRDFGDAEFWAEFYAAQAESYLEVTDAQAATALVSYARDVTVDANVPTEYAGVNVSQADILRAAALGTAILEDTPRVRKGPDYVLMNTMDWLGLMDLTNLDLPAFLALLKVEPGQFQRSSQVPAGSVILGVTQASTFRELGGGAPIRVEALDVAHAGVDSAVYGYTGVSHDRPGGIIRVPLTVG